MKHLLVTNDFPPKIGGIQSLLWEWWRRLPPESFAVLTSPYRGAAEFDAAQPFQVARVREPVLLPHPVMVRRVDAMARRVGAELVVLDPAIPLGLIGPSLALPYDVVLHGAEVAVPGRIPGSKQALGHVLRGARHVIAAGGYPAAEAEHAAGQSLPITVVPPGVDTERFRPLTDDERRAARAKHGLPTDAELIVSISRLVPRKGFDTAIRAVAKLAPTPPRSGVGDRRAWPRPGAARAPRRRAARPCAIPRTGAERRPAGALRVRRPVHHAVPQPVGWARTGRLRHRVRRGRGVRRAASRGRLRRCSRSSGGRRDRSS